MKEIDLNADLGEGCGDDAALMGIVTSANIACGAHAGDETTMRETIRLALAHNVAIGAHPSFPDRDHFGRVEMQRTPQQIYDDVSEQIGILAAIAREERATIHHVKAHGALYNLAARDAEVADAISRAVADTSVSLVLYGLAGGAQIESGRAHGLRTAGEGFADRRYMPDGSLVPRSRRDALIDDEEEAVAQTLSLVERGRTQTICLHGDSPHAIAFAQRIREALSRASVAIRTVAIVLALVVVPLVSNAGESADSDAVRQAESKWLDAIVHADPSALASILAPNFVHITYQGVVLRRDEQLATVAKPKPYTQNVSEETVDVLGDAAIVRGLNTVTSNGATLIRLRFTDVFVKQNGKWLAVSAQESAIAQ